MIMRFVILVAVALIMAVFINDQLSMREVISLRQLIGEGYAEIAPSVSAADRTPSHAEPQRGDV